MTSVEVPPWNATPCQDATTATRRSSNSSDSASSCVRGSAPDARSRHPNAGDWFIVDVVGESVMVLRGDDGELRAFYNVCRHRGARLREEPSGNDKGTIMCPYHAWCYTLKGDLVVTPKVEEDEVDRSKLSLWPVHVDQWQGFVFVNLTKGDPRPLRETIGEAYDDMLSFERFEMDELRIGASAEWMVEANWKIIIENYNECLHCPTVHPELVDVIPAYRKGWVFEDGRDDGGVTLASGGTTPPGPRRCRCCRG